MVVHLVVVLGVSRSKLSNFVKGSSASPDIVADQLPAMFLHPMEFSTAACSCLVTEEVEGTTIGTTATTNINAAAARPTS